MIINLLKIAFRNIWKNKALTVINIGGLSIGISAALVIVAIIFFENSFNKNIENDESIYRIVTKTKTSDIEFYNRGVPVPLGSIPDGVSPEIESSTQFFTVNQNKVENRSTDLSFDYPDKTIFADQSYFEVFSYNWLAGNRQESLSNPNEVVLTIDRALKYFPNLSPDDMVGNILFYNDSIPVKVVGVVSELQKPTDIYFQEFISTKSSINFGQEGIVMKDDWYNPSSNTQLFIKMSHNGLISQVEGSLLTISEEHANPETKSSGQTNTFQIQPLSDLHFNSDYGIFDDSENQGSRTTLFGLSMIALFLVILSTINFINLNTAQGLRRSKEIGIRKSLGGSRKQLIFQFLGEALILNIIATISSILFSFMILRIFSDFIPKNLDYNVLISYQFVIFVITMVIILTILSGLYPAFVLSKYRPELALRGKWNVGVNKAVLRKSLSVFQFGIAQLFIIATLIVARQIYFLVNKDIGFKTESIVNLRIGKIKNAGSQIAFIEELKNTAGVGAVSLGTGTPFQAMMAYPMIFKEKDKEITKNAIKLEGDREYENLFEIKLLAGRKRLNDTIDEYIINETFSKSLGFTNPHDVVGNSLYLKREKKLVPIVGVMEDFYTAPLRYKIEPIALTGSAYKNYRSLNLALEGTLASWPETIRKIENVWRQRFPDKEFNPIFIDETLQNFYKQERKVSFLLKWSTGVAILISLMGLWSLTIYTLETKKKEISIRKIMGASLYQLNFLLIKDILFLIGIGFIISVPLAYLTTNFWLDKFAYKVPMSWWVYMLGGVSMLVITFGVIGYQIFSSAQANPIDSLQME